jgi:hypothetical protein
VSRHILTVMSRRLIFIPVLCALLSVGHAQQTARPAANWAPRLETIAFPGGGSSAEPQFTRQGNRTILSWLELAGTHTTLKFAERTASGWSEVRTAAAGDDFMVNSADVPSVRLLADGSLAAHWLQQDGPDPESYKLRVSLSKDGRTWSAAVSPHRDKVQTQHGFGSLFQAPGAGLGIVWLDGRAIDPDAAEGIGNMALRAAIFEVNGRQRGEAVVDARVCECCPLASAGTTEGVIVAYRNRSADETRDIYVTRLVSGRWNAPVAVHNDGWRIKACPVNGPAIGARGRDVAVAWFTAPGDQGRTFVAFSHDGGRTFGAPVRVDETGSNGRVGVELLSDGSAAVTWVEFARERSQFTVRRVDASGSRGPAVTIAEAGGTRYPRISQHDDELLFAWTETANNSPVVRTARAALWSTAR